MGLEALLSQQIIGLSESIDDRVASLLVAGTGISLSYNDGANTLTVAASFDGSFAALSGKPTTLSGYGITDAQPLDSDLSAIAALTTTSFGRSLLTQADAAATRSTIGAGTGTIGGSGGSTDNAVLRADGTGGATLQGSTFVIQDVYTASPNNTVNHASIQATGATSNVSVSVVPKGTGSFSLHVPDGATSGGNARGAYAVDLQTYREAASHVASGLFAFVVGAASTASGTASQAIGDVCTASADVAIARGRYAVSNRYGMYSHSGWRFSASGDAQYGRFVCSNRTTNATPTTLFLRFDTSTRLTVNASEVMGFLVNLVGSKSDGSAVAHYVRKGLVKRVGSTTTLVYVETIGTDYEDNASTDVAITADDTNDALQINVTGIASETWRWNAVVEVSDLGFGT